MHGFLHSPTGTFILLCLLIYLSHRLTVSLVIDAIFETGRGISGFLLVSLYVVVVTIALTWSGFLIAPHVFLYGSLWAFGITFICNRDLLVP